MHCFPSETVRARIKKLPKRLFSYETAVKTSETARTLAFFILYFLLFSQPHPVTTFWESDFPTFGGFRSFPYNTVLAKVQDLDEDEFNTLPKQPPVSTKSRKKNPKSSQTSSSGMSSSGSTSSKPTTEDPLEPPNIYCDMLKLEGRVSNNLKAEGLNSWLIKNYDSALYEVQKYFLFLLSVTCTKIPLYFLFTQ